MRNRNIKAMFLCMVAGLLLTGLGYAQNGKQDRNIKRKPVFTGGARIPCCGIQFTRIRYFPRKRLLGEASCKTASSIFVWSHRLAQGWF